MSDDEPAVVEWGADEPAERRGPRTLARLRTDRRVVPVVAGLGAAAVLGSVVGEWRVVRVSEAAGPPGGPQEIVSHVVNLPAAGAAYLIGLFLVVSCLALALFGTGPVRQTARIAGLACAAVLAVVLVGTTLHLDHIEGGSEAVFFDSSDDGVVVVMTYGRGLLLAFAGVAALALALWLSVPAGTAAPEPAEEAPADAGDAGPDLDGDELGPDWPWRSPPRTRAATHDADQTRPGPRDLTVEPAAPFFHPPDETDAR